MLKDLEGWLNFCKVMSLFKYWQSLDFLEAQGATTIITLIEKG